MTCLSQVWVKSLYTPVPAPLGPTILWQQGSSVADLDILKREDGRHRRSLSQTHTAFYTGKGDLLTKLLRPNMGRGRPHCPHTLWISHSFMTTGPRPLIKLSTKLKVILSQHSNTIFLIHIVTFSSSIHHHYYTCTRPLEIQTIQHNIYNKQSLYNITHSSVLKRLRDITVTATEIHVWPFRPGRRQLGVYRNLAVASTAR